MAPLSFDAGALIAAQRNERRIWWVWKEALARGDVPTVPAAALAQAWRGARSARLAQLLLECEVVPLDESLAKEAGKLLASSKTIDAVDASVVAAAARSRSTIITSDPADLKHLAAHVTGVTILDLREL